MAFVRKTIIASAMLGATLLSPVAAAQTIGERHDGPSALASQHVATCGRYKLLIRLSAGYGARPTLSVSSNGRDIEESGGLARLRAFLKTVATAYVTGIDCRPTSALIALAGQTADGHVIATKAVLPLDLPRAEPVDRPL